MSDGVLLIGSGGREHTLAWKLAESLHVKHVFVAPGNAGTENKEKISNVDINIKDHTGVAKWCKENNINLVVVGPEDPLANGLSSDLNKAGVKCFGPCKEGAQIEASKEFAKSFMDECHIPTAQWKSFTDANKAKKHVLSAPYDALVVKASGLAAGKGVIVAKDREDAVRAVDTLKQDIASASETIVIEELLSGEEVSVLCFSDGTNIELMPPAQDHKRLLDNDEGPNTGGMGAYCPCPLLSPHDLEVVKKEVMQRAIDGMRKKGFPYVGVLYAGLMLTKNGPKVLEFNCRFGDPETQVILPLLQTDLYSIMLSCVGGKLGDMSIQWANNHFAVGVVLVSGGYPGSYPKGKTIAGLESLSEPDFLVFHAGTSNKAGSVVTSGGRVLAVVAVENSLPKAAEKAFKGSGCIHFDGVFYRKDIAHKAFRKQKEGGLTYKSAGVDIESADDLVKKIKKLTKQTMRPEVCGGIGGFGGIFDLSGYSDPYLVSKVGSIGEKLKLFREFSKLEMAGYDLVAATVNEILCSGAEPLFFLDTYTCGKLDVSVASGIISGIAKGCRDANCALIGGETAEMPGMYEDGEFDLTAFGRGAVEKEQHLPQLRDICQGDIAIGLLSSNLNFEAFQIVDKVMKKYLLPSYSSVSPGVVDVPFSKSLLHPAEMYVQSVLPLMKEGSIKGAAYINKGGLIGSMRKVVPKGLCLTLGTSSKWEIPQICTEIATLAEMDSEAMLNSFSHGIDMVLIVKPNLAEHVLQRLKASNKTAASIGVIRTCHESDNCVEMMAQDITVKKRKTKVAILTSNKGTLLEVLINHSRNPCNLSRVEIPLILTEGGDSHFQACCKLQSNHTQVVQIDGIQNHKLNTIFNFHKIEIICLDGYEGPVPGNAKWKNRILSSHPSLLPAFHCLEPHKEVLELGAQITGCTVHLVESDGHVGEYLEQAALYVEIDDTEASLRYRVEQLLSRTFPKALEEFVLRTVLGEGDGAKMPKFLDYTSSSDCGNRETLQAKIESIVKSTTRPGFTDLDVFDLKASGYQSPYLVSGTDGVGTKLKIAQACHKHDTIGIDLVAMCVNDILTHGAEPLFFMEAYDCGRVDAEMAVSVVAGIAEGCRQANCALLGAELNVLPDIYINSKECIQNFDNYDVVGYAEGALKKENLLPRLHDIQEGDILIGISSSGVHSNGYSLVRKLVQVRNFRYQDPFPLDPKQTIGEVLLTPTKIYVRSLLPLMKKGLVKAAAHITGGGLTENIPRVLPPTFKVSLDGSQWEVPKVLQWIAKEGNLSDAEMLRTFNCGLGMVLIVEGKHEEEILKTLREKGETAAMIGSVQLKGEEGEQVEIKNFKLPKASSDRRKKKVGVLISGSGTNLQALIDYTQNPSNCSSAEIVMVISNVPGVEGLKRAERAGIPTLVLSHKTFSKRVEFDMAVNSILLENDIEIVCLAGFMRIVSMEFVNLWKGRLLNVHPAILPAFKGMNAHKLMLEAGAKVHGCTVHFVEAEVDAGAIIAQAAVRVDSDDDEKSIQEKVKVLEHQIFPAALELLASGRVTRSEDGKLVYSIPTPHL